MRHHPFHFVFSALMVVQGASAWAQAAKAGREGFSFATSLMALTNSTQQGGQGTKGSTVLTETNATYHGGWWGVGLFTQWDKQGNNETDTAAGPRLEFTLEPFYVEYEYGFMMTRSFTDRAIAQQKGKATIIGLGARFQLGAGKCFLQSSYKYRTQTIATQDGERLDNPIIQMDGYPLIGLGVQF